MRYVLFSPIGGTDPMSMDRNDGIIRDGSMLHIVRKYHPEQITLYLSAEMLGHQKADERYTDSIDRLTARDHFTTAYECIEKPDLREVQRYDIYLPEFRELVDKLHARFPKHTVLLNCSSGTPGMKNALYLLGCILPYPVLPIQVSTPVKRENAKHDRRDYDKEVFWELNQDNDSAGYVDRTRELQYENLLAQMAVQNIKSHLKAYDYEAAYQIAQGIREHLRPDTMHLLKAARNRLLLNWQEIPAPIQAQLGIHSAEDLPDYIALSEYLLWLQMKQSRSDLGDFVRGLTPALFALLKVAVEENSGIRLSDYCTDGDKITRDSLERDERGQSYLEFFPRDFQSGHLQTTNYTNAIKKRLKDRIWTASLRELRRIEGTMRNMVAHTITRVDEEGLKKLQKGPEKSKKNSGEIMELVRNAVDGINRDGKNISGKTIRIHWDSYDLMNQKIMESINRTAVPAK